MSCHLIWLRQFCHNHQHWPLPPREEASIYPQKDVSLLLPLPDGDSDLLLLCSRSLLLRAPLPLGFSPRSSPQRLLLHEHDLSLILLRRRQFVRPPPPPPPRPSVRPLSRRRRRRTSVRRGSPRTDGRTGAATTWAHTPVEAALGGAAACLDGGGGGERVTRCSSPVRQASFLHAPCLVSFFLSCLLDCRSYSYSASSCSPVQMESVRGVDLLPIHDDDDDRAPLPSLVAPLVLLFRSDGHKAGEGGRRDRLLPAAQSAHQKSLLAAMRFDPLLPLLLDPFSHTLSSSSSSSRKEDSPPHLPFLSPSCHSA